MISPISLKDVTDPGNLAGLLVTPLVSAATYTAFGLWPAQQDTLLGPLVASANPVVAWPVSVLFFCILVAVCALGVAVSRTLLFRSPTLYAMSGLVGLSFGILGVTQLTNQTPASATLTLLHVAAFFHGLDVFSTSKPAGA